MITENCLLTVEQTAAYLGVSLLTIYDWISQRKVEHIKAGRAVRFKRDTLNKWIEKQTVRVLPRGSASLNTTKARM